MTMASIMIASTITGNFNPVLAGCGHASRARRRVNCVCPSLRRAPAAGHEMAVSASAAALPGCGRRAALSHSTGVGFSLSSAPRSLIRCNAEPAQNEDQQQEQEQPPGRSGSAIVAEGRTKTKLDFQRFREDVQKRRKNFWRDFKEQHVVYRRDRDQWGLGVSPIFTVHEDEEGNRYQVDVNNDEVLRRSGVDPIFTQFADEESKHLAEKRIELAKAHARDIQLGLVNPSPLSIVYQYKRGNASSTSSFTSGLWPGSSITIPAGAPWQFLSILIPLLAFALLGIGVKWLFSRGRQDEDSMVNEKKMRSMVTRKLNAQMRRVSSSENVDNILLTQPVNGENAISPGENRAQNPKEVFGEIVETGQSSVNVDEFQRKVAEIQAMARNARLQEQESAEARSAQSFKRKKFLGTEVRERSRVNRTENLAKDPGDVSRVGAENSEGPDLTPNAVKVFEEKRNIQDVDEGQLSTSESVGEGSDNYSTKQLGSDSILSRFMPNSPKSPSMMPRIILSAEEARARIASKRSRSNASSSSESEFRRSKVGLGNHDFGKVQPSAVEPSSSTNSVELERPVNATNLSVKESSKVLQNEALDTSSYSETPVAGVSSDCQPEASSVSPTEEINNSVTVTEEPLSNSENLNLDKQEWTKDRVAERRGELKSEDEEEEMEWMRDDVLREIVFKVQANEEAGREPFYNLNSDQETLFFKGLERKFAREGDEVKKWIKDRVENIDYGSSGISIYDPPESYELKWKEGVDKSPKSEFLDRFAQDRQKIINDKSGLIYTSPPDSDSPSASTQESRAQSSPPPSSSTAPPLPLSSSHTSPPLSKDLGTTHGQLGEKFSGDSKKKVVISSSPRGGEATGPSPSSSAGARTGKAGKENWDHTKRWAKELERKYAMETDPTTRALMREMGQDLERWITEDEIEEARRLLDNGVEGEEQYVKMHYERTKEKIKRQRETFGRDAMLDKYSEYKEEAEEVELWWLSLPYVVCIGLRTTAEGEVEMGLYSVDVTPALDGVTGLSSVPFRTVAFQDRGDAQNFCTLINSQPEKLSVDGAEPVPFDPKDLYKDAKAEGFKVTVIKKGQLKLSVDEPFDEVESRILELGSAKYFDEMLSDRVIDMGSVVDDGLGFGRGPR